MSSAIALIYSQMAHCLWDNYEGHFKYHLANWRLVSQNNEFGGLGVPNIADMNLCLLASWIKRYQLHEDKMWKKIIDHKYEVNDPNIFSSSSGNVSPFWKGVLWASKEAKMGYQWKVGNGRKIKFWEDPWFGDSSLAIQYWELYVIANEKIATIADVWDGGQLKVTFRRCFSVEMVAKWYEIIQIAQTIQFKDEDDAIIWKLESNGIYTVSSLYAVVNFKRGDACASA